MKCRRCGTFNPPEDQRATCRKCGADLRQVCPRCHHDNAPEAVECASCGMTLEGAGTLAAAATMSGDLLEAPVKRELAPSTNLQVLALAGLLVAGALFIVSTRNRGRDQDECVSRLGRLAVAMQLYARDVGTYPPATSWTTALAPYVRQSVPNASPVEFTQLYACPSRVGTPGSGYALNLNLALAPPSAVLSPATTVAMWESRSPSRNPADLGTSWLLKPVHAGGYVTAYADGHVAVLPQHPPPGALSRLKVPATPAGAPRAAPSAAPTKSAPESESETP